MALVPLSRLQSGWGMQPCTFRLVIMLSRQGEEDERKRFGQGEKADKLFKSQANPAPGGQLHFRAGSVPKLSLPLFSRHSDINA